MRHDAVPKVSRLEHKPGHQAEPHEGRNRFARMRQYPVAGRRRDARHRDGRQRDSPPPGILNIAD